MKNLIATLILVFIIACAIYYIVKQKKSGVKCIGCPHSGSRKNKTCSCNKNN